MKLDSEVLCNLNLFALYRKPPGVFPVTETDRSIEVIRNTVVTFEPDIVVNARKTLTGPSRVRRIKAKLYRLPDLDLQIQLDEWVEQGAYEKWIGSVSLKITTHSYFELRFVKSLSSAFRISGHLSFNSYPGAVQFYEWKWRKKKRIPNREVSREEGTYEMWVNDLLRFLFDSLDIARANYQDL